LNHVRSSVLISFVLISLACASNPGASSTPGSAAPTRAEVAGGQFRLEFELDSATWRADEPITGSARLERLGAGDVISGSGGGPIAFNYVEVDGTRHVDYEMTADCARHALTRETSIVEPLSKSGGWSRDDPDADFYRQFMLGPDIRLPAGLWEITAVAVFNDGPDCASPQDNLAATLRVTITP
jgi:hypothetical protein